MSSRYQSCYIKKLNRYGPSPFYACAVIRFASFTEIVALARAVDLQIADGALGVDSGKAVNVQ